MGAKIRMTILAGLLLAVAAPVRADVLPERIRGTVVAYADHVLTVRTKGGANDVITLAPAFTVGTVTRAHLAAIRKGEFIGAAAVRRFDGSYRALEVHIFPESMRGTGEGNRAWDMGPDSAMINATVGRVTHAPHGRRLRVAYKGGTAEIVVPRGVPVVRLAPGRPAMLKRGRAVIVFAGRAPGGGLTAARLLVESGGVKPPM